jgi:unsaturated rhamnogalacturonyl hydrolase
MLGTTSKLLMILFLFVVIGCTQSKQVDETTDLNKKITAQFIAESFLAQHPGGVTHDKYMTKEDWNYEQGLMLEALYQMYRKTGDEKYFDFMKANMDLFVDDDGKIRTYEFDTFNIDNIPPGRALLVLYQKTKNEKYKKAADTLRKQLAQHPKTKSNGFWHKKIYPNQIWLDGLYMGQPFYAEYSNLFNQSKDLDHVLHHFELIDQKAWNPTAKLHYHAWDESKKMPWANPETGTSPNFWSRAIGWYCMAIVDVLDFIPENHPKRDFLIKLLNRISEGLLQYQDAESKMWRQVTDQGKREGNYLETSASAMFAYTFAKGARKGYLDKKYLAIAKEIHAGIINTYVKLDENGYLELNGTCRSAGLGGKPYRDGSYEYYISEPFRINDFKGYGPFLLTAIELELAN